MEYKKKKKATATATRMSNEIHSLCFSRKLIIALFCRHNPEKRHIFGYMKNETKKRKKKGTKNQNKRATVILHAANGFLFNWQIWTKAICSQLNWKPNRICISLIRRFLPTACNLFTLNEWMNERYSRIITITRTTAAPKTTFIIR